MKNLKPELSDRNPYKLNKHRYYELKHFCLQYPDWKKNYLSLDGYAKTRYDITGVKKDIGHNSPTENSVIEKEKYLKKMEMVEQSCISADSDLKDYILEAVTKERSYDYLSTMLDMPCSRDTYYNRYRKFFWILDRIRD